VYLVHTSVGTMYLLKNISPHPQQQPVAMSNNDATDVEKDSGRGLRDSNKTSDGHGDKGKTGSPHVANETKREHRHLEQGQSQGHTWDSNTDEAHEQWTKVGGQTKGGT
jgi:hypothetical protein